MQKAQGWWCRIDAKPAAIHATVCIAQLRFRVEVWTFADGGVGNGSRFASLRTKEAIMTIPTPTVEAADELTLAVIVSSHAPLLLLDGDLNIIAASSSFCQAFHIEPSTIPGKALSSIGSGEWNIPQLKSLLDVIASGHAEIDHYEMTLDRPIAPTRRVVINPRKLDYGDPGNVRLLLSISDVTDVRLAEKIREDLLRDNDILLRELQHRVANSLQIIASVLMQSAKHVQSDETRTHLYDAHHRVMSVAALQRQLAVGRIGDVELRSYFTELCRAIGASMIRDQNQLILQVAVDDSTTAADVSVSLGLIVTELVINALKHAFPGQRAGNINVNYQSRGDAWTMSVDDNGVGRSAHVRNSPGLGTTLIEALSKQLGANIEIADAHPGTKVSIVHS